MSDLVLGVFLGFSFGVLAGASLLASALARRPSWRVDRAPRPLTRVTDRPMDQKMAEAPELEPLLENVPR